MRRRHLRAGSHSVSRDVFRIGFAEAKGSSAQWNNVKLSDLPAAFAREVVANLTQPVEGDLDQLLTELRRISAQRLTLLVAEFDPENQSNGRHDRLSRLVATSSSVGLVLYDLHLAPPGDPGIWLYFVCNDEHPYEGERLSLLQSATKTIYEHVSRYGFLIPFVEGKRVLDVGCGAGLGASFLSPFASEIVAIDMSREAIWDAQKFRSHPTIHYEQSDALGAETDFGRFDVVICLEVLEHVSAEAQKRLVQNMSRWLTDRGCVVCSTPNPQYDPPNPFHESPLDAPALDALFATSFPYRATLSNAVAMGGIVMPMGGDFETDIRFFNWDAEGHRIKTRSKDEQQQTYFVLIASRSEFPQIKASVSLDVGNRLLQSFLISRQKEQLFRAEESRLLMHHIRQTQDQLSSVRAALKSKEETLQVVERTLEDFKQRTTKLEVQISHHRAQLSEQRGCIEQQQQTIARQEQALQQFKSTVAAAHAHERELEQALAAEHQSSGDLRVALIRNERERLRLKQQLEVPRSRVIRSGERLLKSMAAALQAAFAPIVVPELPPPPQVDDREPETVALWIYTYERFNALHEEFKALIHQIESSPRLIRLRTVVRRLRSMTGYAVPAPSGHVQTITTPQPGPSAADCNDPQAMFHHSRNLHAEVTALALCLEGPAARVYRALHPTWNWLKKAGER